MFEEIVRRGEAQEKMRQSIAMLEAEIVQRNQYQDNQV